MNAYQDMLARAAGLPTEDNPARAVANIMRQLPPSAHDAYAFYLYGNALYREGRLEEAATALRRSVYLAPDRAEAFNDLAATLFSLGRESEAVPFIRRALTLAPNLAEAEETDSIWLLRYGRFREGWRKYESRMRTANNKEFNRTFSQPQWMGEPLDGRTILLHAEQGLGDMLQFVRYVPMVAQRGGRVILEVYHRTMPLLHHLPGVSQFIMRGDNLPPFDVYSSIMSLPLAFRTDLDSIPVNIPYLTVPEDRLQYWRRRMGARKGLRVGIVWSGNPAHRDDKRRSMSLAQFARIIRNDPRISFHILQAEIRDSDKETLAAYPHIHNHAPQQVDFGESAALMLQLDLVIGIDTSVMHLCGALGIPGWVLLMHVADWRWLLARDDSPWYPSLELFRQPRHGDWDAVLDNVSARLDELLA